MQINSTLPPISATTHTYNEATAIVVEQKIRDDYYPLLVQLRDRFAGMLNS